MSIALEDQAYDSKVLDPKIHGQLVKEIESVARRANIPVQMVWTSMKDVCSQAEIDYVRELRKKSAQGSLGLIYVGSQKDEQPVINRMSLVAAACVRNYINAKVMTLVDVIKQTQDGSMPTPTVLLIPNFYTMANVKTPAWRLALLLDMLYSRQQEVLQTFLYVYDMDKLENEFGSTFAEHLKRFETIDIKNPAGDIA